VHDTPVGSSGAIAAVEPFGTFSPAASATRRADEMLFRPIKTLVDGAQHPVIDAVSATYPTGADQRSTSGLATSSLRNQEPGYTHARALVLTSVKSNGSPLDLTDPVRFQFARTSLRNRSVRCSGRVSLRVRLRPRAFRRRSESPRPLVGQCQGIPPVTRLGVFGDG